jgi:hypothetical protein
MDVGGGDVVEPDGIAQVGAKGIQIAADGIHVRQRPIRVP